MRFLAALVWFTLSLSSFAANKYLDASASGSGTGADWTNAYTTLSALETGLARGDVGYVSDGAYGGVTLNTATSGTTTITIKKATVADHGTETGWSDTKGDGTATFSSTINFASAYWVFDGVTGGGPTAWSTGHGFVINHTGTVGEGINFSASNQTVSHVRLNGNNGSNDVNSDSFSWSNASSTASNITVSYCYTNQAGRCSVFCNQTAANVIFEYTHFGSIQGFGSVHGETMSIWGNPSNWTIRYCLITDIDSTGGVIWDNQNAPSSSLLIYGCVFYDVGQQWGFHGNGVIGGWTGGGNEEYHNVKVYNCTFITVDSEVSVLGDNPETSSGLEAKNNLFYSCPNVNAAIWTATHNHFISSESVGTNTTTGSGDPFVNFTSFDFRLNANTTAGTNLGAPYNVDMFGNTRSTWTRGAVEYVSGGGGNGSATATSLNATTATFGP